MPTNVLVMTLFLKNDYFKCEGIAAVAAQLALQDFYGKAIETFQLAPLGHSEKIKF